VFDWSSFSFSTDNNGSWPNADGFLVIDDQRFTSDGMAVENGFFPVLPTGRDAWKELAGQHLLLDSAGEWISAEGSQEAWVDVEGLEDYPQLPAFDFLDE
jgi:hypothetical protein